MQAEALFQLGMEFGLGQRGEARGLAPLPAGIVTGGELVISTVERVENLDGDLNRIIDSAGGRIRRLAAFVAFE